MTRPSASFQLGDVITGEPHLYVANPPSSPSEFPVESVAAALPAKTNLLRRYLAAVRRTFRLGPTPTDALAAGLDRTFRP
jgi:hypothetical protein